ncbi:nucleoporin protein Ndc1-Nup [Aspergillus pseudocaelatus]|uniref:Nucleoporin protein Ndc1-Nup n=1 Tax=Aspergillus pseudocaelatus TaxID=1825620 RepID=A0ABQ6W5H1_9EURO|nr:nucleoporin protein Ndc1-Nup [Aspergillus pseudocaelatus]
MAAIRPRPYRRILTSALHRRFVHASALALLVCYLAAFLIGDKSSFLWAWFPIGACGIRTVLLFICSLVVFVLRVGQIHIGSRTTASPLGTLKYLIPLDVVQTFGWYIFSAWWFSEIYKWSSPSGAHLEWVNRSRPHERASLNERPIYLYTCHLLLAIVQSVVHLYYDFDRVPIPVAKRAAGNADQRTHPVEPVSKRIQVALPGLIKDGFTRSAVVAVACPMVYTFFLRRPAWSFTMYWAKLFWDFPRSAAAPPGLIGPIGPGLLLRTAFSGSLLVLCWQTANLFFSAFLSKEPLKRGQPLTAEAKDPNGSLLTGLTAKKETVKSFAFWELCFISQRFPDRRKAIFNDIDRDGGPAWSQILQSATEVIKGISTRIDEQKNPPSGPKPAQAEPTEPVLRTLPRLTDPLKADNVFAPSPKASSRQEKIGEVFSSTAKSYGQSADWTPTARAKARDVFDRASTAILSPERKQKLLASSQELKMLTGPSTGKPENLNPFIAQLLRSPVGRLFRQTYDRRLSGIVLGAPHANLCPIVDAIESLTRLLIASLQEDQYGKVQADVPDVVRLFTNTIMTLEPFIHGGLNAHWTDVNFPPSSNPEAQAEARRVPDVDLVLDTLKGSLKDLLSAFNLYLKDIGLVGKDLRLAKEAAGLIEEGL